MVGGLAFSTSSKLFTLPEVKDGKDKAGHPEFAWDMVSLEPNNLSPVP
jgi:hypothetical protein